MLRKQTRIRHSLAFKRLDSYRTLQTWKQLFKYDQTMILAMENLVGGGRHGIGMQGKKTTILFGGK